MPVQYLPFFGGGTLGLYSIATGEPLLTMRFWHSRAFVLYLNCKISSLSRGQRIILWA